MPIPSMLEILDNVTPTPPPDERYKKEIHTFTFCLKYEIKLDRRMLEGFLQPSCQFQLARESQEDKVIP